MKIMIIGASGFLGSIMYNFFRKKKCEVLGTFNLKKQEGLINLDALDKESVRRTLLEHRPDVVIDTVALSSSVACEKNPDLCKKMNYETAENLSEVCGEIEAKIIFISSSYVFDGEKGNYSEEDEVNPTNQYAKTKVMAEKKILENKNSIVLRIDITYGIRDGKVCFGASNFDREFIDLGYPDQERSPLFADDFPPIVFELIKKKEFGIFHVAGPTKIRMLDFLNKLASLEKADHKIRIVDSRGWVVKSPKNSSLNISKIKSLGIETTSLDNAVKIMKRGMEL